MGYTMKVFITGIAGFLGSHLAEAFVKRGDTVWGCDNLLGGYRDNVPAEAGFVNADCTNFKQMEALMVGADVVYHTAATAYEGLSVFSPSLVSRNIVDASVTVFSAAIVSKVKRIVHCSSMARYGKCCGLDGLPPPFLESYKPNPQDPYGIAKVCAEDMLKNLAGVHGIDYVIAVPHNIYGPRQKYDDPFRNVASIMMNMMLQNRTPVIYGDGTQRRCFSYISDCLDSLVKMATQNNVLGHTINIGPDEQPVTINGLFCHIANIVGYEGEPRHLPGRPQEVKDALCSSHKARQMLGYETKVTLVEGLLKMRDWMDQRGTRPFQYHLPLEIVSDLTPKTWTQQLF